MQKIERETSIETLLYLYGKAFHKLESNRFYLQEEHLKNGFNAVIEASIGIENKVLINTLDLITKETIKISTTN
tara:strand:- start:1128 stop:1349 length:222 start_codon:yes stop_codon:yes gene_type:complete